MPACSQCGVYIKLEKVLCHSCYISHPQKSEINFKQDIVGLSNKDKRFRYNIIKGRIAETLIQELFLQLEYNVFRYGMENTIPGIIKLIKGANSDVAKEIKQMPDLVIQNPKTNEIYFVEVKFRAAEKFTCKDLSSNYTWKNVYIIVVSKKHIKCITYHELKDGKEISPKSKNYLENREEFGLDKGVIQEFCKFAIQFFGNA